jgi:hypothetical protein
MAEPERGSQEWMDRQGNAVVGLGHGLSFRECCQGTYGDNETDYSEKELDDAAKDTITYYDSLIQGDITLKEGK